MPQNTGAALETALAYFRAWTGHDFDQAMCDTDTVPVSNAPGAGDLTRTWR